MNIYAICFCSSIRTYMSTTSRFQTWRVFFQSFGIGLMARFWSKLSVKSTSSFGPIQKKSDIRLARRAARWAFTRIVAREEEGRVQLKEIVRVRQPVEVAPDIANAWRPDVTRFARPTLGVAISFQSEIQWKRKGQDYIGFMKMLVEHARCHYGCDVLLLPNQTNRKGGRTDVTIGEEICTKIGSPAQVKVFDTERASPLALRMSIASCSAVVSCRYHTCVAAFASAVPTLVLGWHNKYQELVRHYGQEHWMLSTEDCVKTDATTVLDGLWEQRERVAAELRARGPNVVAAVDRSVAYLFNRI